MKKYEFHNVKMEGLKKPQLETIFFNPKYVQRIKNKEEIQNYNGYKVFVVIPKWLAERNNLPSVKLYGRITRITEKAIQLNYANFFIPISQIAQILIHKNIPQQMQTLLTKYEEIFPT